MKWNMGWMHDTLAYFSQDPVYRQHHHDKLTFGLVYAFSENFMLPLSHDEVVHGKKSLVDKMPGDHWQQLANLRLLFAFMWTFPGKKLLFMGDEFAQTSEWNRRRVAALVAARARRAPRGARPGRRPEPALRRRPALHGHDFEPGGFHWVDCDDRAQSVLTFLRLPAARRAGGAELHAGAARATGSAYRRRRAWRECLNSDAAAYGGSNAGEGPAPVISETVPMHGQPHSIALSLPPLGALVLTPA